MSAATMTKERPILFKDPDVRAVLDGSMTETRVRFRGAPKEDPKTSGEWWILDPSTKKMVWTSNHRHRVVKDRVTGEIKEDTYYYVPFDEWLSGMCPLGIPGDRLWIKEAFCYRSDLPISKWLQTPFYRADPDNKKPRGWPWKPSIHMPRHASRITLEIVDIRVDRSPWLWAVAFKVLEIKGKAVA